MTDLDDLVRRVESLASKAKRNHAPVLVGIAGAPGSGKTTLALSLMRRLKERIRKDSEESNEFTSINEVAYLSMDGFHLADRELIRLERTERKGAPDTFDGAGYLALLRRIRTRENNIIYAPSFDRELEQPLAGSIPIHPEVKVVVTEGNYLLIDQEPWREVRAELDEVWYCDLEEEERNRRLIARHERFGKSHDEAVAWVHGTDQHNADLVFRTKSRADLVLPNLTLRNTS